MHNVTAGKLLEESAIMGFPSHYSICPSQLKYQMKNFWLRVGVLHEQLLRNAPWAPLCHMRNMVCLCSWCTEQFINYFSRKLSVFFKFKGIINSYNCLLENANFSKQLITNKTTNNSKQLITNKTSCIIK